MKQYWGQLPEYLHGDIRRALEEMHSLKTKGISYETLESKVLPTFAAAYQAGQREVTEETDLMNPVAGRFVTAEQIRELTSQGSVRKDLIGDWMHNLNMLYFAKRLL